MIDTVFVEVFFHLRCKFAGRFENQRSRHACPRAAPFKARDHREYEAGSLACARLGDTEDVLALERVRNGLFLDWRRLCVTGGLYGLQDFIGKSEF